MDSSNHNRIPSKIYLIVNKCENLPDLRTEKEKKKGLIPKWQVIFPDVKENLSTKLKDGLSNVSWMCECFVTLKSSSDTFSLTVLDENSRKAGSVKIDLTNIPIADNQLIKPGRANEGAREAYRNLQPPQILDINSSKTTISFWIWCLEFREIKRPVSNLEKLKLLSKSATNLFTEGSLNNSWFKYEKMNKSNTNPFENDSAQESTKETYNPFEKKDFVGEFENKFGNSTFDILELPKFRPSVWIPKERNSEDNNPFSNLHRASSLPGLDEISNNYTDNVDTFKEDLKNDNPSYNVSEKDLTNFKTLSEIFKTAKQDKQKHEIVNLANEEFFTVLNDTQRQYATNVIKVKFLEVQNQELEEEVRDLRRRIYLLKTTLINNNLSDLLTSTYQ